MIIIGFFGISVTVANNTMQARQMKYKTIHLKDYAPSSFLIESAKLNFILNPHETIVHTKLYIKHNPAVGTKNNPLKLDGEKLTLKEIKLNNKILKKELYQSDHHGLTIFNAPKSPFVLETTVAIHPAKNFSCAGLYLTNNNFCTQNEPHGFRAITYFIDRPDVLTKFSTTITADKDQYPVLLSNGNLVAKKTLSQNQHMATWEDPIPKSAYLFALVAGKFSYLEDFHVTKSKRKITLRIYADKNQLPECHHAMQSLKQAMSWDEKNFGLEYDLDLYQIVAINDLNYGAMENKGLNVFNSRLLLASPLTATDDDFRRIASVVAHEYFHNWTGNRVTLRDWFQIGLKEGLTTLREQLFTEDFYGAAINRIDTVRFITTRQFAEDSGPLAHPICLKSYINVDNFYTHTVYEKSAEVARMLITIFGKSKFKTIMQEFLKTFDGNPATFEDFLQVASTVTKTNLNQFKLWYDQFGTPVLKIDQNYSQPKKQLTLKIQQKHPKAPKDFYIPLAISLVKENGTNTPTKILTLDKKQHTFIFNGLSRKPSLSLLRDFSAPLKIQTDLSEEDLLFLIKYDRDPLSCYQATQKLATQIVSVLCHKMKLHEPFMLPSVFVGAFKAIIKNKNLDPALKAEMLTLPNEKHLIEELPGYDIATIHHVREFVKTAVAVSLTNELLECYRQNNSRKKYNLEAKSIGQRALKNTCLHYLMHVNNQMIFKLAINQLKNADNLTDILSSLTALANSLYPSRDDLLEEFYQKWHKEPLLVNKWLTINATIKHDNTLHRIKRLANHSGFNIKNPNNVYSLIRAFCEGNLHNFHAKDGSAYRFLTEQIIIIDQFNPNVAASLAKSLISGCKFDKRRKNLLKTELMKLHAHPSLSSNVFEIVNKGLGSCDD
jgi:aminopeptidase N